MKNIISFLFVFIVICLSVGCGGNTVSSNQAEAPKAQTVVSIDQWVSYEQKRLEDKIGKLESEVEYLKGNDTAWFMTEILAAPQDFCDMGKNAVGVNELARDITNGLKGKGLAHALILQNYIERLLDKDKYSPEAWRLIEATFPNGARSDSGDWVGFIVYQVACDSKVPVANKAKFLALPAARQMMGDSQTWEDYAASRCGK